MSRLSSARVSLLSAAAALGMVGIVNAPPSLLGETLLNHVAGVHLLLELFAVWIASLIVMTSWHTFDRCPGPSARLLIAGFTIVAICDLMHAMTFKGMPSLIAESSAERSIFFWLAGRSAEAITLLLVAATFAPRISRLAALLIGLAAGAALTWFGAFELGSFPRTYIEGSGLTPFKMGFEYALIVVNVAIATLLWARSLGRGGRTEHLLALSCILMGLGGFAFSSYATMSDFQNIAGHLYKLAAYLLLYRVTVATNIHGPYGALRESEAQLIESRSRVATLGANLPNSVLYQLTREADGRKHFSDVSESVERVLEISQSHLMTHPRAAYQMLHPEDEPKVRAAEKRSEETLQSFDMEARFILPSGKNRLMHLVSAPRRLETGQIVWDGMLSDITEKREADEIRRKLEDRLNDAHRMDSIGTLASGIAHDFNNVLAAIQGNATLALEDAERGDHDEVIASLNQIRKASSRAKGLVNQILSFSRQDSPERKAQPLYPVVAESLSFLRSTLPANVELVELMTDSSTCAMIDRTQIQQVLMNLCTNAWHAMDDMSGRIVVEVTTEQLDADAALTMGLLPGRYACISVADNGCGMDEETKRRLFEPFFTTKPVGKGTGLGLAVVHGIIRAHEGVISVTSNIGKGTRFEILLPAAQSINADDLNMDAISDRAGVVGNGEKVLYIEDDAIMAAMMDKLLSRSGYSVTCERSPEFALSMLEHDPKAFDVVVTDYNMPKHSGLEVIAEVARINHKMPVILISGYVSDELREKAAAMGVQDLLEKQRSLEELGATIHRALSRSV